MNTKHVPRRCASCKELFFPDARTRHRQTFCGKIECQETRMAENRRSWLAKPENAHYGRDNPKAKQKTKEWRKQHPGYWKRSKRTVSGTLPEQRMAGKYGGSGPNGGPLPEERWSDHPVIMGIIAEITGSTLPEQIAATYRDLVAKGREILRTQKAADVETLRPAPTAGQLRQRQ